MSSNSTKLHPRYEGNWWEFGGDHPAFSVDPPPHPQHVCSLGLRSLTVTEQYSTKFTHFMHIDPHVSMA